MKRRADPPSAAMKRHGKSKESKDTHHSAAAIRRRQQENQDTHISAAAIARKQGKGGCPGSLPPGLREFTHRLGNFPIAIRIAFPFCACWPILPRKARFHAVEPGHSGERQR